MEMSANRAKIHDKAHGGDDDLSFQEEIDNEEDGYDVVNVEGFGSSSSAGVAATVASTEQKKRAIQEETVVGSKHGELERIIKQNQILQQERSTLLARLMEYEAKCNMLQGSLQDATQTKDFLQSALEKRSKDQDVMNETFDALNQKIMNDAERISTLSKELKSALEKNHKLEELKDERSLHAAHEARRASALEEELRKMQDKTQVLQDKIAGYEKAEASLKSENAGLKIGLESAQLQVANLEQKLRSREATIDSLKKSNGELEDHIRSLSQDQHMDSAELEEKLQSRETTLNMLNKEIDERKTAEQSLKQRNMELESQLVSLEQDRRVKLADLEGALKDREVALQNLEGEHRKLQGKNEDHVVTLADLTAKLSDKEAMLTQAEQAHSNTQILLTEALSLRGQLELQLQLQSEQHWAAMEAATRRITELEELNKVSKEVEADLTSRLRDKEAMLASAEENGKQLEQHVANLAEEIRHQLEGKAELENQLATLNKDFSIKLADLAEAEEKQRDLEAALIAREDTIVSLDEEVQKLKVENEHHELAINELRGKLSEKEAMLRQASDDHSNAQARLTESLSKKEELGQQLEYLSEQHGHSRAQVEAAKGRIAELERQLNELTIASTKAEAELTSRLNAKDMMLASAGENVAELEKQVANLNEEIRRHLLSEQSLVEGKTELENQLAALNSDLGLKIADLAEAEVKYQQLVQERQVLKEALKAREATIVSLEEEIQELNVENEGYKLGIFELQGKLSEKETMLRQAGDDHSNTRSLLTESLSKEEELGQQLEYLMEQHGHSKAQVEAAEGKIAELMRQLNELTIASTKAEAAWTSRLNDKDMMLASAEEKVVEREQQLANLKEEIHRHLVVEQSVKEGKAELENQLAALNKNLDMQIADIDEAKVKHQQLVEEHQALEEALRAREATIVSLEEEIQKLNVEIEGQKHVILDLQEKLSENVAMLRQAGDDHFKTRSLLTRSLSHKEDLEHQLKHLTEQHGGSRAEVEAAAQMITQLESQLDDLNIVSKKNEADLISKLRDKAVKLAFAEEEIVVLEKELTNLEEEKRHYKVAEQSIVTGKAEVEDQLQILKRENENLALAVANLNGQLIEKEQTLMQASNDLTNTHSLVTEVPSHREELQRELIPELHAESAARRTVELELELEAPKNSSAETGDELTSQLTNVKARLVYAEEMNRQLEHQLNEASAKLANAGKEIEMLNERIRSSNEEYEQKRQLQHSELSSALDVNRHLEQDLQNLAGRFSEHQELEKQLEEARTKLVAADKEIGKLLDRIQSEANLLLAKDEIIDQKDEEIASALLDAEVSEKKAESLKLELISAESKNIQLKQDLADLSDKFKQLQEHATAVQGRSFELEDLLRASRFEADSATQRTLELEREVNMLHAKIRESEQELEQHRNVHGRLSADIKAHQARSFGLESELAAALDRERNLTAGLNLFQQEKGRLEKLSEEYQKRLDQELAEKRDLEEEIEILRNSAIDFEGQLASREEMYKQLQLELNNVGKEHTENSSQLLKSQILELEKMSTVTDSTTKQNSDLEALVQKLKAANESMSLRLKESEVRFMSADEKNMDLKHLLARAELRSNDADREMEQLQNKISDLIVEISKKEEEFVKMEHRYEDRISELEKELADDSTVQHSLEPEIAVEDANARLHELEQQLEFTETKLKNAEADAKLYHIKEANLEATLKAADEREQQWSQKLAVALEQKGNLEAQLMSSNLKLLESEKRASYLNRELDLARENIESVQRDLEALGMRESAVLDKLRSAEEQLEHKGRALEHATSKKFDLENLYQSLLDNTRQCLQEASEKLEIKEEECKKLQQKLRSTEERMVVATEEATSLKLELDAYEMEIAELDKTVQELTRKVKDTESRAHKAFSENKILSRSNTTLREEMDQQEAKAHELAELLNLIQAERDETAEKAAVQDRTSHLTEVHSRGVQLKTATDERVEDGEALLREALDAVAERDSQVHFLNERICELEIELGYYEEQVIEASAIEQSHKSQLEETAVKVKHLEDFLAQIQSKANQLQVENEKLAGAYSAVSLELESCQYNLNEFQLKLDEAISEKNAASENIHYLKKNLEGIIQHKKELQSKLSTIMEENIRLNEKYHNLESEHQQMASKYAEQMAVHKSESDLHITKLERHVTLSEKRYMEEIMSMQAETDKKEEAFAIRLQQQADLLRIKDELEDQLLEVRKELEDSYETIARQEDHASMLEIKWETCKKHYENELEAESERSADLEKQIADLKRRLQEAETIYKQKGNEVSAGKMDSLRQRNAELQQQVDALKERLHESQTTYAQKVAEDAKKISLLKADLNTVRQRLREAAGMEKRILELEQKLRLVYSRSGDQGISGSRSRDVGLESSSVARRRQGIQTANYAPTGSAQREPAEPTGLMAFRFLLGVILVSVIIGVFLGKRY